MDATSWMLPRSWVVFWNVACPAHPGPRSIEQTPSKQWRWRNGSNTSRVHTPPRVQGKSSTHSCQNWWDWICHRSQGLKISSLSCGSSYFICLLFKQTSHDLMISPLQQWLNHSAPKKKNNTKPPTRHLKQRLGLFVFKEVTHKPPSPSRNFKPSTYMTVVSPNNAPKPSCAFWLQRLTWAHLDWRIPPKGDMTCQSVVLETWILFLVCQITIFHTPGFSWN